jgi:hypothetical protein
MKSLLRSSSFQKMVAIFLIVLSLIWLVDRFVANLPLVIRDIMMLLNLIGVLFLAAVLINGSLNSGSKRE